MTSPESLSSFLFPLHHFHLHIISCLSHLQELIYHLRWFTGPRVGTTLRSLVQSAGIGFGLQSESLSPLSSPLPLSSVQIDTSISSCSAFMWILIPMLDCRGLISSLTKPTGQLCWNASSWQMNKLSSSAPDCESCWAAGVWYRA